MRGAASDCCDVQTQPRDAGSDKSSSACHPPAGRQRLSGEFDKMYSPFGRDSIAPEKLLRALLLQAFFSVRSERQLMEQITYNMMFRWFVGLSMDAPVWDVTVFTKNRATWRATLPGLSWPPFWLERAAVAVGRPFLGGRHADRSLGRHEEFQAEGWLWLRQRPVLKAGAVTPRWISAGRQQRDACLDHRSRCAALQESQGPGGQIVHMGHVLTDEPQRPGGAGGTDARHRTAEREAASTMIGALAGSHRITVGGDKAYDTQDFVAEMRRQGVTPHVAQSGPAFCD